VDFIVVEDLKNFGDSLDRLKSHKNIRCVIVGGGDGSVMTVLNTLKGSKDLTYGFLPLGTTNVFARNLGLPLNIKKSLHVVANHHARPINLGSVNGTLFLSTADVGLSTEVVKELNNRTKRILGPMSYYLFGLLLLQRYQPLTCDLHIGKDRFTVQTYDLAIVNGRYYGPMVTARNESVFNDSLTIFYGHKQSRFDFVHGANKLAIGRQDKRSNVFSISTQRFTLRTKEPQDIQADGEIVSKTPAEIKIVKDAIRVLVPPSSK
jgi:YegS/Rv2252/BmrU family lipid kinase